MDRNEWYRAGEDIRDQVQRAVDTGDFAGLGKTIGDTVNRAVDGVGSSLNRAVGDVGGSLNRVVGDVGSSLNRTVETVGDSLGRTVKNAGNAVEAAPGGNGAAGAAGGNGVPDLPKPKYRKPNVRPDNRFFDRHPKGEAAGIVCMAVGYSSMVLFALILLKQLIGLLLHGGTAASLLITGIIFLAGLVVGVNGSRLKGRTNRYRVYVDMVKEKLYCPIQDIASGTGRSVRYIRRDLKKMMRIGMFKQAHLDQKETCLIASDEIYEQYKRTQKHYEESLQKTGKEERDNQETTAESNEARKVIEEGQSYVRLIRQCNDEIPGEEMTGKLDRLETLVTRIFAQVEREPQLAPELRKMLSFYLPTTKKLLEAYRDLDRQQIDVSNIAQTKREIETAVDTINESFEKFLDELFREKAWDIQSDISVLHTMLKQDGYLQEDFGKRN